MNATMKMVKHRVRSKSYMVHMKRVTNNKYRKNMARTLCEAVNVPKDRPLTITNIQQLEDLLGVNICFIGSIGAQILSGSQRPGSK